MSVVTLKLLPIEPPELLQEALTDKLFADIRMRRIPVFIKRIAGDRTHGYCQTAEYTQQDEIVIADELLDVRSARLKSRQLEEIVNVYLHECAHRLCGVGHGHNAAFLAINMLLHMRAGGNQIWHVTTYDFHEERHYLKAWEWAYKLARELEDTELSAEGCSAIVLEKYKAWQHWMDGAEERRAAVSEGKKIADQEKKWMISEIMRLRKNCWHAGFIGFVIGGLLAHWT